MGDIIVPEGWMVDVWWYGTVISKPMCGFVTVDFKSRNFSGGDGAVYHPQSSREYHGRGWKQALVNDAVEWLTKVHE